VLVKVTPLDERDPAARAGHVHRLTRCGMSRARKRAAGMGEPELFLVSFFSYEPDASFQPEDLQIVYQSRLLRPGWILPLTSGWGRQRLDQQETQTAIYALTVSIDFDQVLHGALRHGGERQWRRILVRLENERGQIRSRIG
jgi:hypothetical protein